VRSAVKFVKYLLSLRELRLERGRGCLPLSGSPHWRFLERGGEAAAEEEAAEEKGRDITYRVHRVVTNRTLDMSTGDGVDMCSNWHISQR
jgi:hypothetical protein